VQEHTLLQAIGCDDAGLAGELPGYEQTAQEVVRWHGREIANARRNSSAPTSVSPSVWARATVVMPFRAERRSPLENSPVRFAHPPDQVDRHNPLRTSKRNLPLQTRAHFRRNSALRREAKLGPSSMSDSSWKKHGE
jgi:hypothetical protein